MCTEHVTHATPTKTDQNKGDKNSEYTKCHEGTENMDKLLQIFGKFTLFLLLHAKLFQFISWEV